jgi:hypothetical protein
MCVLKFHLKVGVEKSIVNAPRITDQITDQLFKANRTFCVVYVFTLQIRDPLSVPNLWCIHNRLFNANFEIELKKNTRYNISKHMIYDNSTKFVI